MRIQLALATTTALALALTACGGPPADDGADDDAATTEDVVEEEAAEPAAEGEVDEDGEASEAESADDAAAEDEAEEPEPAASASPTPAAAPVQAAAPAAPPQSFTTCAVCHSVEPGQNMIGPSLAGVVGRQAGAVSGATYSLAMQGANVTWNEANLRRYIVDPAAVVPGGTMPAPGVNAAEAQAIVNYLKTL